MTSAQPHRAIARANRRLAAALVVLGLVMQMVAPYLPMPAMGGLTSWDLAWLPICETPQSGTDRPGDAQHHQGDCAACLVMQQAGATLAPDLAIVPVPLAVQAVAPTLWQQASLPAAMAAAFSSRAPPLLG
ncbi:MAG TPA: DUF2946 family protein [Dongiaceae bacterium]|nr:DUF2946 family protein [Dongiaceae bacterium]